MPEPAAANWGVTLQAAICNECDWQYLLPSQEEFEESEEALPVCPHCRRQPLEALDAPNLADDHPPELLLPFAAAAETLQQSISDFAGGLWFAPGDLTPDNLSQRLQRVYLPMWLVDSQVQAIWQLEAGFNYDAISHRDQYKNGAWHSEQITETRLRWEARVGRLVRQYDNVPAPALEEHHHLLKQLGAFNIDQGQPYRPNDIDQAFIRLPNRSTTDAWPDSAPSVRQLAAAECRQAIRADAIRDFRWTAGYPRQHWTLLLLPVYMSYYLDDERQPQTVLLHGQTAHLSARRRASMKRAQRVGLIIAAVAAAIFTISLLLGLVSLLLPPLLLVAAIGFIAAIVVGMLAITPLVMVWSINRSS